MDMLIRLYALPPAQAQALPTGGLVRKPIGPEHELIAARVGVLFGPGWESEARVALGNRPVSLYLALQAGALAGFACYDATARGYVGPIGVTDAARGQGLGAALLLACLHEMRALGYGYAVAGAVGAPGFFARVAGATEIAGSSPGLYAGMLRAATRPG